MYLSAAASLARKLMNEHGLEDAIFRFSRSKTVFGRCKREYIAGYMSRPSRYQITIELSEHIVRLNPESEVRNTILHEIAHALVGNHHGHDWVWKAKARAIGCDGIPCYSLDNVVVPRALWEATCSHCDRVHGFNRKPTAPKACKCTARLRARDGFDAHRLTFTNTRTGEKTRGVSKRNRSSRVYDQAANDVRYRS